eukprot:10889511-Alexandrium_andersonii.AAC.1
MSASLVGSEMCIRDRSRKYPSRASGTNIEAMSEPRISSSARPKHLPQRPVSYTHLTLPTICSV